MKILAFTDTHSNKEYYPHIISKAKESDIIISAGDFGNFGEIDYELFEEIEKTGKPFYFVFGTHESEEFGKELEREFENFYFVHNKVIKVNEYYISGFGDLEFKEYDKDLVKLIHKLRNYKNVIFISHVPPYDTALDIIWNEHRGNPQLSEVIYIVKPKLYICGHFHENFGVWEKIHETLLVNPGPYGMIIEI